MNIYFSGIGGVGLGPLAEIAHRAGYKVFGSDLNESPTSKKLEKLGIEIKYGKQDGDFLRQKSRQGIDWFIYTSALPKNHPELMLAKELKIKTSKRDELLNKIIKDKNLKLIAAAGTHGKTTTSGMLVWALKQLGVPVSWSVGATLSFGESGLYDESSEFFIYEADEFDRNFLHFSPFASLITNIDHDHTDIYKTKSEYFEAFSQFSSQSEAVFGWKDDFLNAKIEKSGAKFPFDKNSPKIISEIEKIKLAGEHNRQNAFLVKELLTFLGFDEEKIIDALNSFPGTDRRFEKLKDGFYSDYGHHPVEIKATLQMADEICQIYGKKGVALVYQPHQNVRQVEVQNDYTEEVFQNAQKIIWLPTYLSRENPDLEILTPEFLARNISQKVSFCEMNEELLNKIKKLQDDDYLILAMSAGSLDGFIRKNINKF